MKVAIYARFSSDLQSDDSIDDQFAVCRRWAERNGHEVVATFEDRAISGTKRARPGLQAMLDEVERGKGRAFRAVLVESQSRLSRDLLGAIELIFRDLLRHGVRLLDTSGFDSTTESGEMQAFMGSLINANYIRQLGKQVHRSLGERARNGQSCGGSVYGYRAVPDPDDAEHKVWSIDEVEAKVVRRIFDLIEAGTGYRAICHALNADGIAAPRAAAWSHQTIIEMVRNERYAGRLIWNRTKTTKAYGEDRSWHEERPESEHVARDAPELAIITAAQFERVQRQLATRKPRQMPATRKGQIVSLASGLLYCGACGASYSVRARKRVGERIHTWYGCTAHAENGKTVCAQRETISAHRTTEALVAHLRELLGNPTAIDAFVRGFERRAAARMGATKPADLEKQLAKTKKRASNATALLVEAPSDVEARQLRDEARAEVKRIEAQLVNVAAPATLPNPEVIAGGLRRLLDLLVEKPEAGHAALVRCGLKLRVVPRPQNGRRFLLVGRLDLGGLAGGGSMGDGSGYGLNGCSSLPRTGLASRRATASCSSLVRRRTYTPAASIDRAPKKPSETAYSTSMIMYGSSPIHISSCLRGIPTHELKVNLSRDPSSLRTTIVMRSVAVIEGPTVASLEPEDIEHVVATWRLSHRPRRRAQRTGGEDPP